MYPMCNISKGIIFPFIIEYLLKLFGRKISEFSSPKHFVGNLSSYCAPLVIDYCFYWTICKMFLTTFYFLPLTIFIYETYNFFFLRMIIGY